MSSSAPEAARVLAPVGEGRSGTTAPDAVAPPPRHPRFPLFDGMRAVAVLCVVATHAAGFSNYGSGTLLGALLAHLNIGVTLFFLISGFLLYRPFIAYRGGGAPAPRVPDYAKRRVLRIYPAYWLALTILILMPGLPGLGGVSLWPMYTLTQVIPLYHGPSCSQQIVGCALAHTWSLGAELTFYLALPAYVLIVERLTRRLRLRAWVAAQAALLGTLSLVSMLLSFVVLFPAPLWFGWTLPGTMFWFALGMGLAVVSVAGSAQGPDASRSRALAFAGRGKLLWPLAIALYVALCAWLPVNPFLNTASEMAVAHVVFGLVALLLLAPMVFGENRAEWPQRLVGSRPMAWLGLISYGIFLWHFPIQLLISPGHRPWEVVWLFPVALALSVACAAASYYLLERPVMRLKYRPILPAIRTSVPRPRLPELGWPEAVVGVLTLTALVFHVTQIGQSLFGDEVLAYNEIASHTLRGTVRVVATGIESSPPLFFVLAWGSAKLGHPSELIRLPSIVLGAATIPVVYLLARETVGRTGAVLAAALLAASPFMTYYGVEARPYATMEFFVALSTLALLLAVRTDLRRYWVLYALAVVAAAYSHYTAIFVLAVQGAWALWVCRRSPRHVLAASGAAAALYLPWLPSLHGSALGAYAALEPLTSGNVLADLGRPLVGYPYVPLGTIPTLVGGILFAACALLGLGLAARRSGPALRAEGRGLAQTPAGLIVLAALATPAGLLAYSLLRTDIWSARSLIASVPAATVLVGALLAAIPLRPRLAAGAVTLGVLIWGSVQAVSPAYRRPPYRAAASYLDRAAAPSDPVLLYTAQAFVLDYAIAAQFERPHLLIQGVPRHWPSRPPGSLAFVVVDDNGFLRLLARALRPPGWAIVATRRYRGLVDFTVLTYRAL